MRFPRRLKQDPRLPPGRNPPSTQSYGGRPKRRRTKPWLYDRGPHRIKAFHSRDHPCPVCGHPLPERFVHLHATPLYDPEDDPTQLKGYQERLKGTWGRPPGHLGGEPRGHPKPRRRQRP